MSPRQQQPQSFQSIRRGFRISQQLTTSNMNESNLGLTTIGTASPKRNWFLPANASHKAFSKVLIDYEPSAVAERFVRANQLDINPSVSSYCASYFASVYQRSLTTSVTSSSAKSTTISPQIPQNVNGAVWPFQSWPALVSPCCGQCSLTVNSLRVHYWPTPAVRDITTSVNNAGYTL
jgi:hypothetical protein